MPANAGVARDVFPPAAVGVNRLGPDDSLRLSATAVLVVRASDRSEHAEHHGVESCEHAGRELVAWSRIEAQRLRDDNVQGQG
jgi:hypothetical protein